MAIPRPAPRPANAPEPERQESAPVPIRRPVPASGSHAERLHAPKGFVKSTNKMKDRLIVSLTGEDHSGKNHMAFTAPSPIYVHSFDPGIEGVIEKFNQKKDIYVANYELEIQPGEADVKTVADCAARVWEEFLSNYRDGLASCGSGTTVVDTDTEAHELIRLARFGKLQNVMPHHYGPVNAEFRDFLREGWDRSGNIYFLSKRGWEWENYVDSAGKERGRKTGNMIRKGFTDLPFHVHVCAISERTDLDGGGSEFQITITDCRQTPSVNGLQIENDHEQLVGLVLGEYL